MMKTQSQFKNHHTNISTRAVCVFPTHIDINMYNIKGDGEINT